MTPKVNKIHLLIGCLIYSLVITLVLAISMVVGGHLQPALVLTPAILLLFVEMFVEITLVLFLLFTITRNL